MNTFVRAFCVHGGSTLDDLAVAALLDASESTQTPADPSRPRVTALDDASLERFTRLAARGDREFAASLAQRFASFEAALNQQWLAACPPEHPTRYLAYNRLAALAPASRSRLLDATRSYGFLWPLVLASGAEATRLADCIERAEPLAPVIAEVLAAQPWQVRALQRAFADALSTRDLIGTSTIELLLAALDEIAPEQAPATRAGWLYLVRAIESTDQRGWLRSFAEIGFDRLAEGKRLPKTWRRFARVTGLKRQLSDLRDLYAYAAQYEDRVWLPVNHERDLRAVLEVFDRWKAVTDPRTVSTATPSHLRGVWSPVLAAPMTVDEHVVHELASGEALREDGYLMKHCIGGYAQLCEEKGSRIFSLRDADGRRLSTFQIHYLKGAWHVLQHRAKTNCAPPAALVRVAAAFVERLNAITEPA